MNPSLDENPAEEESAVKPFLEHLEDLRTTIIRCVIALAAGMGIAFPLSPGIMTLLRRPLIKLVPNPDAFLQMLEVNGAFSLALTISFWSGLLFSAPFLVFFIAQFVFPALRQNEKKIIIQSGGFVLLLFMFGVALGYFVTLPTALAVMLALNKWMGIQAQWTATSYITFCIQLILAFGIVFELPIVLLVLGRLGIVKAAQLRLFRRHMVVVSLIIGMILTPSTDIFSQLIMAVPLMILYEMCIWVVWMWERRAAAAAPPAT